MRACTRFGSRPASAARRAAPLAPAPRPAFVPGFLAALAAALLLACASPALATTYFSSPGGTDPTNLENWWTNPDSTGWHPADFGSGDMFVVQGGHSMSTASSWAISGAGSALWIQSGGTLTVGDGAAHRLELTGSTFQIDAGGTYVHDSAADWDSTCFNPGVTAQFNAASTVVLRAAPLAIRTDIAWGNLTIALATSPGADWSWEGHLTRVHGDLTVTNTGGYEMRLASDSSATLTISGALVLDGGDLQLGSGVGAMTVNVAGDFTMTAGAFGSSGTGVHTVVFTSGLAPRTFTQSGGTLAIANVNWQVDTETLKLVNDFTLPAGRTMTVASPGTLALAAAMANAGTLIVNGTLRLEAGGSLSDTASYGGGGTLEYAGGSVTAGPEWGVSGPSAPLNVTIAAGAEYSVALSGDRTVLDTLAFTSGTITTGPDTLTLGPACRVVGAGAGRYVSGNLARVIPTTLSAPVVFDVGDAAEYAPVEVAFDTVRVQGTLAASTAVLDSAPAPGEPPAGSGISQSAYVNRVWRVVNGDASPVGFDSCSATFHFVAADVLGWGDPELFVVARDSSGTWSNPVVRDPLATSITATGLGGFGDFYAGEPAPAVYALTVTVVGAGTVTKVPDQEGYLSGTTVELTAAAAAGWTFAAWGGDATGNDNPLTVTMDRARSITARFTRAAVVVSQVFGGGGDDGTTYANDFIELYNRGAQPVDVTGWTVQYAPAADSVWSATALAGTIPAGGYYLVREARGPNGGLNMHSPDASGNIAMDAVAGKVALVCASAPLDGACPGDTTIVDLVGYGDADCSETSPVGALSSSTAALRDREGCEDTNDNLLDFSIGAPAPRNSLSPVHYCEDWVGVDPPPVTELRLAPVAPNPSRGGMRVSFALPAGSGVRLRILDLQGRVVATLVDGFLPAGGHEARWDGSTAGGAARSGLYFVRLEVGGQRRVRSAVLVR